MDIQPGSRSHDLGTAKETPGLTRNAQGVLIQGAATLWKATNDTKWQARTLALWNGAKYFFDKNQVMFEICELPGGAACNQDQQR
jgi:hypothetical protein